MRTLIFWKIYYIKFSLPVSYEMLEIGIKHHLVMNARQSNWKILKNSKMSNDAIFISTLYIRHENEKDFQNMSSQKILQMSKL
jgi:hypothetical protein